MSIKKFEDELYFDYRNKLKEQSFTIYDLDHYPLFVGGHNMGRNFFLINQLVETLDVPGNIYEFGLWKGATTVLLAKFLKILKPQQNKIIIGFDNFSGLPEPIDSDGEEAKSYVGRYKGDKDFLMSILNMSKLESSVHIVDGDANLTIPSFFEHNPYDLVSFALLDFDLYEPTITAIRQLISRVSVGGKIIFDEGSSSTWKGEKRAMYEFSELTKQCKQSWVPLENPITRQPTTVYTRVS